MKPDKKRQSQQAFDQQAATYDTDIQGSHARTLYPYMLQEITRAWGDRVLDLGCGTGALTAQVLEQDPRRQVTGLDLSEQMLAQARARLGDRVKLIQGDSECLPFPDGSFDVVYCCDSFHHYPDPAAVLAEVGRVLVPGGVFLLGDIWLPLGSPEITRHYAILITAHLTGNEDGEEDDYMGLDVRAELDSPDEPLRFEILSHDVI